MSRRWRWAMARISSGPKKLSTAIGRPELGAAQISEIL